MKAEQMWKLYAERHQIDAPYEAWAFCGGGEVGDQLADERNEHVEHLPGWFWRGKRRQRPVH